MPKKAKHQIEEIIESPEPEEVFVDQEITEKLFTIESLQVARRGNVHPLASVENGLKQKIIGQNEAIESLMVALNREKFRNPKRPLANLLFLGPTGVGKTETAKALNEILHGIDADTLIKINCSEIGENHRVSALIGAAPEYVGRDQKPLLDKRRIEQHRSIVLFDEIEKGAPKLHDLLLQILEDGEVTLLNSGQKVSFKNSIVIMTSNIGAREMMNKLSARSLGFRDQNLPSATRQDVSIAAKGALERANLRPELLNRIDHKIVFRPLDDIELGQVLDRHVNESNDYYRQEGISLVLTPEVRDWLVTTCDERHQYGARPVLRRYEQWVEGLLADYVNSNGIPRGSRVYTFINDDLPGDTPLNEKIELRYAEDESLIKKSSSKALEKYKPPKEIVKRKKVDEDNEPLFYTSRLALGAAIAGIALRIASGYIGSRKKQRIYRSA
jgi:ATP-dependent Clp protease ATP-binding subunit ClpA